MFFFFFFLVSNLLFLVSPAFAQSPQSWTTTGRCVKSVTVNPNGLGNVTYNDIATIQGFAFLFMFISGGFKYLLSSGEQKAVATASSTLTMAFIGLIGIIASWLILSFIQQFTGVNITQFIIPG